LLDHATAFYKDLFGPDTDSGIRLESNIWSPEETLDDLDREVMDREFSEEEIKKILLIRWRITKQLVLMVSLLNFTKNLGA
jgi:hypothetical protein